MKIKERMSQREQLWNNIIEDATHSHVPIRPGRSFERNDH